MLFGVGDTTYAYFFWTLNLWMHNMINQMCLGVFRFASFFLVCFSFSFLWQAQTKPCFKFADSMWPQNGGASYYPTTDGIPDASQSGGAISKLQFSGWFSVVGPDGYPSFRESSGAKKPPRNASKLRISGLFGGPFWGFGGWPGFRVAGETPCCYLAQWARESVALRRQQLQRQEHRLGDLAASCACDWWDCLRLFQHSFGTHP